MFQKLQNVWPKCSLAWGPVDQYFYMIYYISRLNENKNQLFYIHHDKKLQFTNHIMLYSDISIFFCFFKVRIFGVV